MVQSEQKLIVVLVNKRTGEIVDHKEISISDLKRPYHVVVQELESELTVEYDFIEPDDTRFFTGMANSLHALVQGYPEMQVVR